MNQSSDTHTGTRLKYKMASMSTLLAAVLCVAVCYMHAVDACGETLLSSNFNSHQGGWQHWNRGMAERDFPVGLGYTKGIGRADVGEGALRIKHPAGALPSHCLVTDGAILCWPIGTLPST